MGNTYVKNGTPIGNEHLCRTCCWGQFMTGYRESDVLVICTNARPNIRVPFVINECSEYQDKNRPDWEQMEKLAIEVRPATTLRRTRGFQVAEIVQPEVSEADEEEAVPV